MALGDQPTLCFVGEAVWKDQTDCWRPGPVKWKIGRNGGGSGEKKVGLEKAACGGSSRAHLCAMQWLRGGWPSHGGWPLEAFQRLLVLCL